LKINVTDQQLIDQHFLLDTKIPYNKLGELASAQEQFLEEK